MKNFTLKLIVLSLVFAVTLQTINAQCSVYGSVNPVIAQVTGVSPQLRGYFLRNVNGFYNKKVVGDFDGNGIDDLFIISDEPLTGASANVFARLLLSNGIGGFTLAWTSSPNNLTLTGGISIPLVNANFNMIAGNFTGDNKDEVLIYNQPGTPLSWFLIGDLINATPTTIGTKSFSATGTIPAVIGTVSINARFFAANLTGDNHDELFSLNIGNNSWNIQSLMNTGALNSTDFYSNYFGTGWIGSWQLNSTVYDDIYFANFDLSTTYDEIFLLRKGGGWSMMQKFNVATNNFTLKWTNYGNGGFFMTNQCAPYSYLLPYNTNYDVYFGNLDNCDQDIECLIIPSNDIEHPITLEFNSSSNSFRCWSVKWPTMTNASAIAGNTSSFAYTAYERWSSERHCVSTWFGVCVRFTGGESHLTQRDFYNVHTRDGSLDFLIGNFYNNISLQGFSYATSDLLVFRNNLTSYVPSQMNGLIFLTNCTPEDMNGPHCPNIADIRIYNLLGQYIGSYNRTTGLFNTTAVGSGSCCMYSLTNNALNL